MREATEVRSIAQAAPDGRRRASVRKKTVRLGAIAHARSGDKGNSANIAVFADTTAAYELLRCELTAERVATFFCGLGATHVERYEVPNLEALNFVLVHALGGGGSRSLRIDSQGKALAQALLELELPVPPSSIEVDHG